LSNSVHEPRLEQWRETPIPQIGCGLAYSAASSVVSTACAASISAALASTSFTM
jgi:hypothetical protein